MNQTNTRCDNCGSYTYCSFIGYYDEYLCVRCKTTKVKQCSSDVSASDSEKSHSELDSFFAQYAQDGNNSVLDADTIRKSVATKETVEKFKTEGKPFHLVDPIYGDEIFGFVLRDEILVSGTICGTEIKRTVL